VTHRPPCPICEGSGRRSTSLGKVRTFTWGGRAPGKTIRTSIRVICGFCGGEGRVHPDTLDSYLRARQEES
jgi:hypothetical protein